MHGQNNSSLQQVNLLLHCGNWYYWSSSNVTIVSTHFFSEYALIQTLQGSSQYEQYHIVTDYYTTAFHSVCHLDISLWCCQTEGRNRSIVFRFHFHHSNSSKRSCHGEKQLNGELFSGNNPRRNFTKLTLKHFISTNSKYFFDPKTLLKSLYSAYISFCNIEALRSCLCISVSLCSNKEMKSLSHTTPCCSQMYPNPRLNTMFLTKGTQHFSLFRSY